MRALPLVGILFLAIVVSLLHAGRDRNGQAGPRVDRIHSFNAANLAEVFGGGLQVVPQGQSEAGLALGLSRWRVT